MLKDHIQKAIEEQGPLTEDQLVELFQIHKKERKIFREALEGMVKEGYLYFTKKEKYILMEDAHLSRGELQGSGRDFCYFIPDDPKEPDVFVHASKLNGAIHKDVVLIKIKRSAAGTKSPEGEVERIIERNKRTTGVLEMSKDFGFVVLDDKRYGFDVHIKKGNLNGAKNKDRVVLRIDRIPDKKDLSPDGTILEVIGKEGDPGVDITAIARQFDLPDQFPKKIQEIAAEIPQELTSKDRGGRTDLRDLYTVTIDGATAKDFDDAISLEKEKDQYVLYVHIADVAHYVKKNSALDKEALRRGNSVYLLNRVIPMLPVELSNGICSLNPGEERLTLTVRMWINDRGKVVDHKFYESVILSNKRLIYKDVSNFLEGKDHPFHEEDLKEMLQLSKELRNILRKKRDRRGSLDFDFPEPVIEFDEQGRPVDIYPGDRRIAEQIIEEFMLVTNETVGKNFGFMEYPFMYRIHEEPDEEKIEEFRRTVINFGYHIKGQGTFTKDFQQLLEQLEGKPEKPLISKLLLRSMQKARYSEDPDVHFGLATMFYSHFTAPIRRYSDLFIHRIVKNFIHNQPSTNNEDAFLDYIAAVAKECSQKERRAELAEREATDMKMAEYMEDKIGEIYPGIISSLTNFGIFVQLPNTVEGLL
ncbi:MAG: ribonuclease R, partial [Tissierellia bacterium]|nr:ribonuclease R [Tissierellia bacterium]